jgi:hypothetical protein
VGVGQDEGRSFGELNSELHGEILLEWKKGCELLNRVAQFTKRWDLSGGCQG